MSVTLTFRLRDSSCLVRKNTIMVLTHLILNDMVKVKGQISELAICIVDDNELIANRAQLFFSELSKKVSQSSFLLQMRALYCSFYLPLPSRFPSTDGGPPSLSLLILLLFLPPPPPQGNAVYNIMPDLISRLSDPEAGVKETDFKIIMK